VAGSDTGTAPEELRILPLVNARNEHFWRGGEHGELRILRCRACGYWNHPPTPICPRCHGKDLAPEATSGRATVHTFTINHQPWYPGLRVPFVLAVVELPEQDGLRLTTNIVGCPIGDVRIGMPVRVTFQHHGDVWLPFFTPEDGARAAGPAS
jgi:uncharacterized OB-fold protein